MSAEGAGPSARRTGGPGPDFLGIGSSRCGTTFLHATLRRHPRIWLPPVKELHFFDRLRGPDPVARPRPGSAVRVGRIARALRAWGRGDPNAAADVRFLLRYRRQPHDLAAYRRWFEVAGDRMCGEITPAYCALGEERVALVGREFPDLRLVLVMRDPIDRAWSAAVKSLARDTGRPPSAVSDEEWIRKLRSPGLALRSDHLATLDRWGRHFPSDRIWVGFFDDLEADPDGFVARLCRFLGVVPVAGALGRSDRGRNAAGGPACPPEYERLLAARFLDLTRRLHERFGSHATGWYHRALRVLDAGGRPGREGSHVSH